MHHGVGDVGMKLKAERIVELKRLDREIAALGQQFGARGEFKTLAVPMIHMIGPMRADPKSCLRWTNRVIADLGEALGMRRDPRSKLLRQQLRAEADAQKRALLAQRNGNPVDFAPDEFIRIVGAHRASEDDRAGMSVQGFGKRVAEAGTADVEDVPQRPQRIADAPAWSFPGAGRSRPAAMF